MYLHVILFLDSLGGGELFVIILFALMFFGSEKIPGLMRSLGAATRTFKNAMNDVKYDIEKSVDPSNPAPPVTSLPRPGTTSGEEEPNMQPPPVE